MENVGIEPRITCMGSMAWCGERALKPRSDRVHWIVVEPLRKACEPLILMVLVCWVHKLGGHKWKPISMGDTNLGGHRFVCIVEINFNVKMPKCLAFPHCGCRLHCGKMSFGFSHVFWYINERLRSIGFWSYCTNSAGGGGIVMQMIMEGQGHGCCKLGPATGVGARAQTTLATRSSLFCQFCIICAFSALSICKKCKTSHAIIFIQLYIE
jgi:hypothetical protein